MGGEVVGTGMSSDQLIVIAGTVVAAALIGLIVREFLAPRGGREGPAIATIEERVRFSAGGWLALFMLLVSLAGAVVWFAVARTVIEQAAVGAVLTANAVIWCTGLIVGRRRTYVVRGRPGQTEVE